MLKDFVTQKMHTQLYGKLHSRAIFSVLGISFKEFKASFTQFFTWNYPVRSLVRSLKYCFLAILRIFLGRTVRLSYAYTGEDRTIESLLKPIITKDGFFVDVGCNHPLYFSNTFLFYKRGWRGICIDANDNLIKKYKLIRPRDVAVCALVSDKKEELEFIELTNNVLSSADKKYIEEMQETGQKIIGRKKMSTRTLTEILDECQAPSTFDILSVDIEEYDYQALKSLDFKKYQPTLIITEAEGFNPEHPETHPIFALLKKNEYIFQGSLWNNLYFMKK